MPRFSSGSVILYTTGRTTFICHCAVFLRRADVSGRLVLGEGVRELFHGALETHEFLGEAEARLDNHEVTCTLASVTEVCVEAWRVTVAVSRGDIHPELHQRLCNKFRIHSSLMHMHVRNTLASV